MRVGAGAGTIAVSRPNGSYDTSSRIDRGAPAAPALVASDDFTGTLSAFDESDGRLRRSVELPGSLDGVVAGGGSVWVLDHEAGVVSVVDPNTLTVLNTIRVGGDERDIAFGADAVWLADGSDRTVTRIDPVDRRPTAFEVPGDADHVTVDEGGDLWVLSVPEA